MHHYDPKILLIVILGGLGIYLMLPKVGWSRRLGTSDRGRFAGLGRALDRWDDLLHHPRARWMGAALAGLALVSVLVLFQSFHSFVFGTAFSIFAILAIISGMMMITSRTPVYSALWFALVVLSTAGLFLLQGGQFLAAATVIIYAGAIIVTFLFVIMLAQQEGLDRADRRSREPLLASLCGSVLLWCLLYAGVYTFGGWHFWWIATWDTVAWWSIPIKIIVLAVKAILVILFMMWVRWTFPRFRYDQLMGLAWKVLIPIALVNLLATAFFIQLYRG